MQEVWNFILSLLDPRSIITYGGVVLLLFVIFAETGLFFGFFLPGDSLLFISGLFCVSSELMINRGEPPLFSTPIYILIPMMSLAGILGNFVGYWFGWRAGEALMTTKRDTFLFKKKYMILAQDFYQKYGAWALIMGRFMPIIRTFAPIFAGVVKLNLRKFTIYNILGSFFWISTLTLAGYILGREFPWILNYIHYIVIGMVVITTAPVLITLIKNKKTIILD